MMSRIKLTVSYEGTAFSGYQVQPGKRTVQSEIESALTKMHKGKAIRISASGRTDAGVHAAGQVIHFDTPLKIPEPNWAKALNTLLPDDILAVSAEEVRADFHARFDVVDKEYHYHIHTDPLPDLFTRKYTWQLCRSLDLERMQEAAVLLIGEHDFSAFCAANTDVKSKVRTVRKLEIEKGASGLVIKVAGNGFLYQMVRIITGTLTAVGLGKLLPGDLAEILESRDRKQAAATAPPQGLFLYSVKYKNEK